MAALIAEYAIRTALLGDAAIAALVGTRFYPHDAVPQDSSSPILTYQRFDRPVAVTLDADEEPSGPRLQINCLASTAKAANALGQEVRRFFRGGYSTTGVAIVRLAGGGALPRDPDSKLFGYRIDLLVTMAAAEVAA